MIVVEIGGVRVVVLERVVAMAVRVRSDDRRLVHVIVVAVVVPMLVLVLERAVQVAVSMSLGDVKPRTGAEREPADQHREASA